MLAGGSRGGDEWKWTGGDTSLSPAEAIAAVASAVFSAESTGDATDEPVLVVPNGCTGAQQQDILDAARRHGLRLRLLWRPVAGAMEWCRQFDRKVRTADAVEGESLGRLLCLHMGLDGLEAAVLKIVPQRGQDGRLYLVPARPRPKGDAVAGFGLALVEKLAERAVAARVPRAGPEASWRLLWSTPWLPTCLAALRGQTPPDAWCRSVAEVGFPDGLLDQGEAWPETYASMAAAWDGPKHGVGNIASWSPQGLTEWIVEHLHIMDSQKEPVLGAVVTGPLAGIAHGDQAIGLQWLSKSNVSFPLVLCEGRDQPQGLLARGAALHATRLAAGLPTYLDTLPRLEVVVTRFGEPAWQSLLQEEESFVDGGRLFRKEGVGRGEMCIDSGSATLEISLHHEEHPTVREHTIHLPRVPDERMPISLDVSLTPAQGNARVEVQPDMAGFFGRHSVVVDWKGNMRESGKDPDEYLAGLPGILPPASPREGSRLMWGGGTDLWGHPLVGAAARIDDYLHKSDLRRLNEAIRSLQLKDRSIEPGEYTAVSSEGRPGHDQEKDRERLDRFVATLMQRFPRTTQRNRGGIVRALAYTSTRDADFATYLSDRIDRDDTDMTIHDRAACGWCLREPDAIGRFATAAHTALRLGASPRDWIKPLWEILRYREDATCRMTSEFCLKLTGELLGIFQSEVRKRNFKFNFRYASGSIAYLLRRRRYDTAFLDPASGPARTVKDAFQNAISLVKDHPENVIGGFIKIDDQLRLIIDYIDLRGHGPIMI